VLAVILLSDEEDCSITDKGEALFDLASAADPMWGKINLRCGENSSDTSLIYPTAIRSGTR
jgi:hypothetical protein